MVCEGGSRAGDADAFEKFSPARIVFDLLLPIVVV
jgi:hypothetical protein